MTNSTHALLLALALVAPALAAADDRRASANYMIHCQGCHLPDATGWEGAVPRMKDFAAYFLHSPEGRDFLIQVPGVATADLPDEQLAELMNWVLVTFSAGQMPRDFEPYTAAEVGRLRATLIEDPEGERVRILEDISRLQPSLAAALDPRDSK